MYFLKVVLSREWVCARLVFSHNEREKPTKIHRLRLRERLPNYNTIADAVSLIRQSHRIVILTGAGISEAYTALKFVVSRTNTRHSGVSCGIPDFRSRNGLYASLKEKGEYDLDDPQQMYVNLRTDLARVWTLILSIGSIFSISRRILQVCRNIISCLLLSNHKGDSVLVSEERLMNEQILRVPIAHSLSNWAISLTWARLTSVNRQIYPSNFIPSPCHRFIKLVEDKNKVANHSSS